MYARWMAFAHGMQVVVQTILFSLIYLVVVPLFALVAIIGDTMGLRRRPTARTFWVRRRPGGSVERFFERM